MGCFGRCNCGDCCMDPDELVELVSNITVDGPSLAGAVLEFESSNCCHIARRELANPGYTTDCKKIAEETINESSTTSVKIIESQKFAASPAWTIYFDATLGSCIYETSSASVTGAQACGEVINCGTTEIEFEQIEEYYFAAKYRYLAVNIAIYKREMICPPGTEVVCRYVVECTIEYEIQEGGGIYNSFTRDVTYSDEFGCCERTACDTEKLTHDPAFDCETDLTFGNPETRYMTKVRVYDTLEDIPSVITFNDDTPITQCNFDFCVPGALYDRNDLGFCIEADNVTINEIDGGVREELSISATCFFCLDTGASCDTGAVNTTEGEVAYCPQIPGYPCDCENNRFLGRGLSSASFSPPYDYSIFTVAGASSVSVSGCHQLKDQNIYTTQDCPPSCQSPDSYPGVDIDDRTECNWWDCSSCIAGEDPIIMPYQNRGPTVDAYSFSQSINYLTGNYRICVPFPPVTVTLNP
jgi:hypothetical protein